MLDRIPRLMLYLGGIFAGMQVIAILTTREPSEDELQV